ncbi:MAG TPA: NfeD family protein, partial [Phototrophicaceae bacterium]|jgi:membrane-bound ClpP family serine protease|nr:NfeD family protein [Phototrophicaceae bacterium]
VFASGVVGFILIPFFKQQYTRLSLGGLILQALGGYFLFHGLRVQPEVVAVTIALSLAYHYFVLLPALRQLKLYKHETPDEVLIGSKGRVVTALSPIGIVQVNSERWTATSTQDLPAGTTIVVLERNGLQLLVEPVKDKRQPHEWSESDTEAENNNNLSHTNGNI